MRKLDRETFGGISVLPVPDRDRLLILIHSNIVNSKIEIQISNFYATIRPLFWLLLIEVVVFALFALLPQSQDVYVYLLEDGFWENFLQVVWLFLALMFLCCASGISADTILSLSSLNGGRVATDAGITGLRNWVVSFLWYFPLLAFLFGLYKVLISHYQNETTILRISVIYLTVVFFGTGFFLIYKIRRWIRVFIEEGLKKKYPGNPQLAENLIKHLNDPGKITSYKGLELSLKGNYKPIVRLLVLLFAFALLVFVVFAAMPANYYYWFGAAALLVFGLGCWTCAYLALEMLELLYNKENNPLRFSYRGRTYYLSFKLVVLAWVLFCSYTNDNHPVQRIAGHALLPKVSLRDNLAAFAQKHNPGAAADTLPESTSKPKIPIVFVAVDGGANRTGLFGASMLAMLQDKIPAFKEHVFAYSSISGGTVGTGVFYSLTQNNPDTSYIHLVSSFFKGDFLAAITGSFMFGEGIGYFLPFYSPKFDRARALEKEWHTAWQEIMPHLAPNGDNAMKDGASKVLEITGSRFKPVVFINSHEVETGRRAVYSNVTMPDTTFSAITYLNSYLRDAEIPLSSALLLSARFPLVSPAASIKLPSSSLVRHYVDGGYFESSGTLTLYEALKELENDLDTATYSVFVLHLSADEETPQTELKGIRFLNEPMEIISAAIKDRSGHTHYAVENLKNHVSRHYSRPAFISLSVGGSMKDVPINWVLSANAIEQVRRRCLELWERPELDLLKKSFEDQPYPLESR